MTANEALEELNKVPIEKRDLPLIAIHGASGCSYELEVYARLKICQPGYEAGILCDMSGEEYLSCCIN